MSFNNIHKLKPKKPEANSGFEQKSDVLIEFLILPDEQINGTPIKPRRQTGGVISAKHFSLN